MDLHADRDEYHEWSSEDEDALELSHQLDCPDLLADIAAAIEQLGGSVVPKFTWSCPKDAVWMTREGTTRCRTVGEVLLLLKSSDRVMHDVSAALDACLDSGAHAVPPGEAGDSIQLQGSEDESAAVGGAGADASAMSGSGTHLHREGWQRGNSVQHVLALRAWYDLRIEREFRCFVVQGKLVGEHGEAKTHRASTNLCRIHGLRR